MKIIADNHAADYGRPEGSNRSIRKSLFLDHIGGELRGAYGDVESEPLPDALSALAALLDRRGDGGDKA